MNSEDVNQANTAQASGQPGAEEPAHSAGQMLHHAREQQGLSRQAVADKLFLKVTTVEDIEQDKIDASMSVTFTKGYVRNYAKFLGLDPQRVLAEFDKNQAAGQSPAKLQSFSQRVAKEAHDDRWMMVTYVILFLLLAGTVAWWYQQDDGAIDENIDAPAVSNARSFEQDDTERSNRIDVAPTGAAVTRPQTNSDETQGRENRVAGNRSESQESSLGSPTSSSEQDTNSPEPQASNPEPAEDNAQTAANTSAAASPVGESAAPVQMEFTFTEDCWVNIEDASGEVIATGIKSAGRVMPISGVPPISVTLGAPDKVSITYAGQAVDISQYQNGRTARFTLPMQE